MSKGWVRYFAAGAVLLMIYTIASFWLIHDMERQSRAERERQLSGYWDAVLTAYYDFHGDWRGLEPFLSHRENVPPIPTGSGSHLRVWDKNGNIVFGSNGKRAAFSGNGHISLLHNGEVIGYMSVDHKVTVRIFSSSVIPTLILFIAGITALALFLYRVRKGLAAELRRILDKVARMSRQPAGTEMHKDLPGQIMAGLSEIERRLVTLERVRKTMVADVAHELRTPLATIRTMTENALESGQGLETGQIGILHDEAFRMSKLINDLNQLALAESGHLRLEKTWFSLADLLRLTMEAMMPEAEERNLRLEWYNESVSPLLFADRVRLQQVFVNLLGNAMKHARSCVSVRLFDSDAVLCFSVSDDGAGMEREELPYIFDRFYRSNRRSGGLGLGLAIVKEFVSAHGGDIAVRSGWNEGSTFTVRLPSIKD
ncbi:sensor histidine kinase [Paenibacillus thermotolerans]|uniref:sensor histidine kinase n=1 Tax=Paenibacillus thermotolerans TaxID=3027807 RepID=UPI002367E8D4|nr:MULTISPECIES: HAMP domain-containing sensor histidine kinase [unclassified Paenibacillus]